MMPVINQRSKKNLSEEDKDMIVNEISLVIQNIISFFFHSFSFQSNFSLHLFTSPSLSFLVNRIHGQHLLTGQTEWRRTKRHFQGIEKRWAAQSFVGVSDYFHEPDILFHKDNLRLLPQFLTRFWFCKIPEIIMLMIPNAGIIKM